MVMVTLTKRAGDKIFIGSDLNGQRIGVTEQDASDIVRQWRQMIECGNPKKEQPKEQDD